jgi:hypothetical protein
LASNDSHPAVAEGMGAQLISAGFKPAGFKPAGDRQRSIPTHAVKHRQQPHTVAERAQASHPVTMLLASYSGYVVAREEFVVTMTSQGNQPGQWQVQVWQLRVLVPASQAEKVTPRKT